MPDTKQKRRSPLRTIILMLVIILLLAALLAGGGVWYLRYQSNYRRDEDVEIHEEVLETETELHAEDVYDLSQVTAATDDMIRDTFTLLVIGGEMPGKKEASTEESEGVSSAVSEIDEHDQKPLPEMQLRGADAIILMTVNHAMGYVYFCSLHTNSYADIPGYGGYSLGTAYALGEGPMLIRTLESNYGIHIDHYASIDLKDVAKIMEMPEFEQLDISTQGLDVLQDLVYGMGTMNSTQVASYITRILPKVTHNLTSEEMWKMILQIPRIVGYYSETDKLPYEGMYREIDGYLVPDIGKTSEKLKNWLYQKPERPAEEASESTLLSGTDETDQDSRRVP